MQGSLDVGLLTVEEGLSLSRMPAFDPFILADLSPLVLIAHVPSTTGT